MAKGNRTINALRKRTLKSYIVSGASFGSRALGVEVSDAALAAYQTAAVNVARADPAFVAVAGIANDAANPPVVRAQAREQVREAQEAALNRGEAQAHRELAMQKPGSKKASGKKKTSGKKKKSQK